MWERLRVILRKEFIQALREPRMRVLLFLPPFLQLLIFGYAVTLDVDHARIAWMLVTTLNFWPSFQISGSLMSLGGNISHKRLCVGELGCVSAVFLNALAISNNFLSKWSRHLACPFFVFALLILGDTGWKPVPLFLAARNRRDDADFVTVFQRRFPVFQEADVFLVHINVHKTAHLALVIHEAFLDAGEARLQFDDRFADGGGVDFDQLLVVGQLAERCWDSDFFWHKLNFNFFGLATL